MDHRKLTCIITILIITILSSFSCQNTINSISSSKVSSYSSVNISSGSSADLRNYLGEWLVLYETYEIIDSEGIITKVITNTSSSITNAACYTLLFKSNFTVDLIDYTNGSVSVYSTNYYNFTLYEDTKTIELISPIDVEETVYYETMGKLFQAVTNSRITNAVNIITNYLMTNIFYSIETNFDPDLFNSYAATNYLQTNLIFIETNYEWDYALYDTVIYSNFTYNYQITNVYTDRKAVFMQPVDIYDTVKNSKSTISIFNYRYTIDANGSMKWKPSLESSHFPKNLKRSHTRYSITENTGTNGYYQQGYSYMHFPEFNSIVDFKKVK